MPSLFRSQRAPLEDVELDVGTLQPRIAAGEQAGMDAVARHRAGAEQCVTNAGRQLAQRAVLQVVQRDRLAAPPGHVRVEVVVQVGADRRHVAHHVDADVLQVLRRSQTRQQQKLRRSVGAARDDDLAARARRLAALCGVEFDADRAVVLDQHARGVRAGADHQVGTLARRLQIGLRGAPAATVQRGRLVVAAAFLLRAVEVGIARDAGLHAGLQHRIGQFELARLVGHVQRAADAVEVIRAAGLVLGLLEERQDRIPVPALAAALAPFVVIAVVAADIHHAVDRAGAAERLAARQI